MTQQRVLGQGVEIRSYLPEGASDQRPVVLYLHGGTDPDDSICRILAAEGDLVVFNVGYRPAPAPLDDADRALQWVRCVADEEFGADPSRIAVVGTGAGGDLAAALASRARDRDESEIVLQLSSDVAPHDDIDEAYPAIANLAVRIRDSLDEIERERHRTRTPRPRKPAIEVNSRIEPATVARLDQLARWDVTDIATIRSTYATVRPAPVPPDPRVQRSDEVIPGIDGRPGVRVRWYRPVDADRPLPCLVYFHGGAYIMGTLDENDDRLDRMVLELGCAVVSVDWRLAPEHPYPEGLDDAETVWRQVAENPATYGIDASLLVVGGASAGAGLAAALCLRLREIEFPQPKLQLLVYPMLDDREVTPSIRAIRGGPGHWGLWHTKAQRLAWSAYLGSLAGGDVPPTAAPARAQDLSGLAPAFVGVGDVDAYLDENVEYAARLSTAGVPTELHVYPGVIHGGFVARPYTPRTAQFLRDVHEALRAAFAGPSADGATR